MKSLTLYIAAALVIPGVAAGQDLNKDITIERQLNTTLRAAGRLGATPTLVQPEFKADALKYSQVVIAAQTEVEIDTLPAAAPQPPLALSPYRGYAALGYFPAYNLGASAGYRVIDKERTSLGVWGQFDGLKYSGKDAEQYKFGSNAVTLGADLTTIVKRAGRLDVSADFTYNSLYSQMSEGDRYGVAMVNADIHWSARNAMMAYYITGDYHLYKNSNTGVYSGVTQHDYNARGGTAYFLTDNTQLAGSIGVDFLSTNHYLFTLADGSVNKRNATKTLGLINFDPAFRYKNECFKLNLGIRLQFMSHMSKSVNVAPDIHLYYTPRDWFGAFVTLTGGKEFNRLARLSEWCMWINPEFAYEAANIPLDATIGFTVGPFKGVSATVKGGYTMANEWLMPTLLPQLDEMFDRAPGGVVLSPVDLRAFRASVEVAYRHSALFEGRLGYEAAPGSESHAYMGNRDRAKGILTVEAKSSPIDKLTVDAKFTLRHGRALYADRMRYELNSYNSLDLGGQYRVTPAFTVLARIENLLNCRSLMTWEVPYQGIHGAIGAAIKF